MIMTKTQQARKERLMPNGIPRYIHVYDNGGRTADRYTIVYTRTGRSGSNRAKKQNGWHQNVSMSASPFHPLGVCMHGESETQIDYPSYSHLGKKIAFQNLPEDCQKVVLNDYQEIWNI